MFMTTVLIMECGTSLYTVSTKNTDKGQVKRFSDEFSVDNLNSKKVYACPFSQTKSSNIKMYDQDLEKFVKFINEKSLC